MSLTVEEHKYYRGDKLQSIEYVTEFIDNNSDGIMYYMDAETGMYTDYGYCIDELQCYTNDWRKVAEDCCKQYGCELVGEELKATAEDALVQTMLAIYAWIEFKDWLYYDQIEEKRGIMHDKGE